VAARPVTRVYPSDPALQEIEEAEQFIGVDIQAVAASLVGWEGEHMTRAHLLLALLAAVSIAACSEGIAVKPPTFVCSPHGEVGAKEKAWSPDGKRFAMLVDPLNFGRIGIFDARTEAQVSTVDASQHPDGEVLNAVKAMAWDDSGQRLAALFHERDTALDGVGHISLIDVESGKELGLFPVQRQGRCARFIAGKNAIDVAGQQVSLD
jgi:hypothetical protein